jgi:hypothetical protein
MCGQDDVHEQHTGKQLKTCGQTFVPLLLDDSWWLWVQPALVSAKRLSRFLLTVRCWVAVSRQRAADGWILHADTSYI